MPHVHRPRRSIRRASIAIAAMLVLAAAGFLVMRSGHGLAEETKQAAAEHAPVAAGPHTVALPGAPATVASPAVPSTSAATVSTTAWQQSAQPAVVAVIRSESLSAYQAQVEHWTCEGDKCVGNFRIPPTVEAGRRGDISAAANIMQSLAEPMARAGIDVALQSIHPGPQGLAIAFEFTPAAAAHGRFYTDKEITAIRAESFDQGGKSMCKMHGIDVRECGA